VPFGRMAEPEGSQNFEIRPILRDFSNHLRFVSIHLSLTWESVSRRREERAHHTKSIIFSLAKNRIGGALSQARLEARREKLFERAHVD
jgi:hypothetical protein